MLERIVVSLIGDKWSPQTAPPKTEEIVIKNNGVFGVKKSVAIGRIIANVPQLVPIENEIKKLIRKNIDVIAKPKFAML